MNTIKPKSEPNSIMTPHFWQKKLYEYGLRVLLVLQLLYFGSLAPEALLDLTKYFSIPDNNPIVEQLTDLVDKKNRVF